MKQLIFILSLILLPGRADAGPNVDSMLNVLNIEIENRTARYKEKENRISALKEKLSDATTDEEQFLLNNRIFEEYKSYQYDSAYIYASKTKELAEKLNNAELKVISGNNLLFCFMSSGLFKEACDVLNTIDVSRAGAEIKCKFYFQCVRLYSELEGFNRSEPFHSHYLEMRRTYCDSAFLYAVPDSYDYYKIKYHKEFISPDIDIDRKINNFLHLLNDFEQDQHQRAMNSSALASLYNIKGEQENTLYYTALSAVSDIRSAVRETTSKTGLAHYLYNKGDLKNASKYINVSLEEANFYNARHRKTSINNILPIIEKERLHLIEKQKNILTGLLVVVCLILLLLLGASLIIYKQNKKLTRSKKIIQDQLGRLEAINKELNESNVIKDQYIIDSLYGKSNYLDTVESLLKKINNKLKARQYDDIYDLGSEFNIKTERENVYSSFDNTFLKLFPDFIHEYNTLFNEEDRIPFNNTNRLTTELRIFALIRLGITDNERIAKFLNLSVATIYKYRTKARSKSTVLNDEFEKRIVRIRKGSGRETES